MAVKDIMIKIKDDPGAFFKTKQWLYTQGGIISVLEMLQPSRLSEVIDFKFITYFCGDYASDHNFEFADSYSYGMKNPDEFINEEPKGENGEYSDEQKEEAAMKAEEIAMDDEVKEFARNLNNNWDNRREFSIKMLEELYDHVTKDYLDMQYSASESLYTIESLLNGYQQFFESERVEDFEDFETSLGIAQGNPFEGDPMFQEKVKLPVRVPRRQ